MHAPIRTTSPKVFGQELIVFGIVIATVQEVAPETTKEEDDRKADIHGVMHLLRFEWERTERLFWQQLNRLAMFWKRDAHPGSTTYLQALRFVGMIFGRIPVFGVLELDHHGFFVVIKTFIEALLRGTMCRPKTTQTSALSRALDLMVEVLNTAVKASEDFSVERERVLAANQDTTMRVAEVPRGVGPFSPDIPGLAQFWQSHALFVTEKGHYGLGPQALRPGDVVFVISGCEYPAVLRPGTDCHYFVGNAYCTGVTVSEISKVWNSDVRELGRFRLR